MAHTPGLVPAAWPSNASIVYRETEIAGFVARMAGEIARDLGESNPIVMPILMGGVFTAIRLTGHFRFAYEMDSIRVARYGDRRVGGELHWYARPCLELDGRHVLLVDDVLDRGITLQAVAHELRRMNAASVRSAVLIRKHLAEGVDRPAVDYVGAEAPDRYLFGCGMDVDGRWRGLGELWALDA